MTKYLVILAMAVLLPLLAEPSVCGDSVLYVGQGMGGILQNPDRIEIHSITNSTFPDNESIDIRNLQISGLAYNRYFSRDASTKKFAPNGTDTAVDRYNDTYIAYHAGRVVNRGENMPTNGNSKIIGLGYSCAVNETPTIAQLKAMAAAAAEYVNAYPANNTTGYKGITEINTQADISGYRLANALVCNSNDSESCWINPIGGVPLNPSNFQPKKFCREINGIAAAKGYPQRFDLGIGYNSHFNSTSGENDWWGPIVFLIRHDIPTPPGYTRLNMT